MLGAPTTLVLPLYLLFLYLSSLRVFQLLGTVHIQKEVLQQSLCFLQIPGILWLELKSLVLLVIAGILETREDRGKKAWLDHTDLTTFSLATPEGLDAQHTDDRGTLVQGYSWGAYAPPSCLLQHLSHPGDQCGSGWLPASGIAGRHRSVLL